MKKLMGRTDVDDALKRLDKLTHEEARMATTEILKVTHTVDNRVRGVSDQVAGVDDQVAAVAAKVSEVIDGTQYIFNQRPKESFDCRDLDGKQARTVMDEMRRSSSPYLIGSDEAHATYRDPVMG